jgi:hypothetical protein
MFLSFLIFEGQTTIDFFGMLVPGFFATTAWVCIFFMGIGYAKDDDLANQDGLTIWMRAASFLGLIPAAALWVHWESIPEAQSDIGWSIYPMASLAVIPALHLELVRALRARSNNPLDRSGPW